MEYPKINSLWKRQGWYFDQDKKNSPDYQKGRQSFIEGDYANEAFRQIKSWRVTEKVDGTNIRICFKQVAGKREEPFIGGRTESSSIPAHLLKPLMEFAKWEAFDKAIQLPFDSFECWLFGEGYGPKIQSGSYYRSEPGFILFDVKLGRKWLMFDEVKENAEKFGVPSVPDLGFLSESEIVDLVKSKPRTKCGIEDHVMEGIVARAEPFVYDEDGDPLRFKLKCKEFN